MIGRPSLSYVQVHDSLIAEKRKPHSNMVEKKDMVTHKTKTGKNTI
jgi:hypothetical protein